MDFPQKKQIDRSKIREFEEKLIIEVKNHSCLYAKNVAAYSNKNKRNDAWEDIAAILGRSVEECQKKWTTLRDSFRAYFRAEQNVPSGSAATPAVKWSHFNSLKFLIPYVRVPGDDCGNFSDAATKDDCSSQWNENEAIDVETEDFGLPSEQRGCRTKKPRKRLSEEPLDRVLNAIECTKKNDGAIYGKHSAPSRTFYPAEDCSIPIEHFESAGRRTDDGG